MQRIDPLLASDFRNLAQVALAGRPDEVRRAMLRIGYFDSSTAVRHQTLIRSMFEVATEPLRQTAPFDFGSSDLLERLRDMGMAIGAERELNHVPPPRTLFLHRKIGGMYLMAAKLRAHVFLRPLVEAYCSDAPT